jgi:hypothetical protein
MENNQSELPCPFCNRLLLLRIEVPKQVSTGNASTTMDRKVEEIRKRLPQDIVPDLNVALNKYEPDKIHVTPKRFLGRDNFWKVSKILKELGGEYVSQGKQSYWWVPIS